MLAQSVKITGGVFSGACVVNTTKQRNMAGDLRFSYELEKVKLCTDVDGPEGDPDRGQSRCYDD